MIRFFFRLILIAVIAALLYGLWATYREKSPEQRREIRKKIARIFEETGRILGRAGKKALDQGQKVYEGYRAGEKGE